MDATHEEWRPIVGYEGLYEVSDLGRVKSLARKVLRQREGRRDHFITIPERILRAVPMKRGGYPCVQLSKRNVEIHHRVHQLVLETFVGPKPRLDSEVRHLNDIPTDNRLVNLTWGTKSENMRDAVRNGGHANASKTHCKRGHEFTPENTAPNSGGGRRCRACRRLVEGKGSPEK